jgi:hypothetical protein
MRMSMTDADYSMTTIKVQILGTVIIPYVATFTTLYSYIE